MDTDNRCKAWTKLYKNILKTIFTIYNVNFKIENRQKKVRIRKHKSECKILKCTVDISYEYIQTCNFTKYTNR